MNETEEGTTTSFPAAVTVAATFDESMSAMWGGAIAEAGS